MKLFIAIVFATIAFASSADTDSLFAQSHAWHQGATELQKSVTNYAIEVRTAVPRVLGRRANSTIAKIEFNVDKLLDQETETREAIYSLSSTNCIKNLRVLLNSITEFTGFESSNCVARYDLKLSDLIQTKYSEVASYEKTFSDVLRVVPKSFSARNMFIQYEEIGNDFTSSLTSLQAQWDSEEKNISQFEENFGQTIDELNDILQDCFGNIQVAVNPTYAILANEIATCGNFDNSHDPFAVFQ